MVFSSLDFIFLFAPLFFSVYYLVPGEFRNIVLFVQSLVFYAYGTWDQPLYVLLFLASAVVNWFVGLRIVDGRHPRLWLTLGLLYDFGWLFVFKYANFLFSSAQTVLDAYFPNTVQLPAVDLVLPIGISFYTFQIVSYLLDVYRHSVQAERSLLKLSTYLYMFPQLIAGPIVTYGHMKDQMDTPDISFERVDEGLKEFTFGLGLKVLLANRIGGLWTDVGMIGFDSISTPLAWMGIVAFSMQLYFDFWGYSMMAVGLGKMLGFNFPHNFRHPYLARSMTDFWRRWHITLGAWFRDYVYIPLGGNRKGKLATVFNLLFVWILTGLWHGADWNFLAWGLLLFVIILLEKILLHHVLDRCAVLAHAYMALLIPLSWLVFAVTDFGDMLIYFERLFPFLPGDAVNVFTDDWLKYGETYGVLLAFGLLFCTALPSRLFEKLKQSGWGTPLLLTVFWGSVYCLYIGMNDPFLYFRF